MTFQPHSPAITPDDWPEAAPRFLSGALPPPPELPLEAVFGPVWARWIRKAAEAKSAPPDYVMAGLLATAGAAIGNSRWVSPWAGWSEPPIIWTMLIGAPSSNKSPGLDAVLGPLRAVERGKRKTAEADLDAWCDRAEIAKLADSGWREATKAALKEGAELPEKPPEADPGAKPVMPCLVLADCTVERLAVLLESQPRGTLVARDELSGWLMSMTRYAGGGSDRPFWLEAYGGRSYRVERMGRDPVHIDHLSLGVTGSIQPDRLRSLLIKTDDDGLLARFLPIWPQPAPIKRPDAAPDEEFAQTALTRLHGVEVGQDEHGNPRPLLVTFSEEARDLMDAFRQKVRHLEDGTEGLLLSFSGKLPGLTARIALVLTHLDWVTDGSDAPCLIDADAFKRAVQFVEGYVIPMARRAYADASVPESDRGALRLVETIIEHGWTRFASRDVLRLNRRGLATSGELAQPLKILILNGIIRPISAPPGPLGGRPAKMFAVNPLVIAA
ncbi:DUF3987 domain-containing protein [Boseongicola sp. H5]|uniref:DUF3987 domain-containing protein n=1 Tax=Boseongicola sp. H5 TaxID=2763261 RepID=UPI001D0B8314|nr:DUF3987 domain-containing protein [Boseongicola sp. H5]